MKRSLRILGIALGGVLATVAAIAPAAQAELTFTGLNPVGGHTKTIFRAAQTEPLTEFEFLPTAKGFIVKCSGDKFNALSETGKSKSLTSFSSSVTKCKFGPSESTTNRNMNSCNFTYSITKKIEEHKYEGTTSIQCTTKGDAIDYEVPRIPPETGTRCTIKLEEQSGIGPIYYEVHTAVMAPELGYFVIRAAATNVKSITEAKSGLPKDCGVTALGTHTTGTLNENTTVTGLSEEIENEVIVSG